MTRGTRVVAAALVLAGLLAGCRERRPAAPLVTLDRPEAVLERRFQQVSNVVELSDGRIAFAELRDRQFLFADLTSGQVIPVGEHTDSALPGMPAPGQHKFPGYVLLFPGDTVGLVDFALERTTLWTPRGDYVGQLGRIGVGGLNQAVHYDSRYNAYKEDVRSVLGGLEPGSELEFDSLNVLRIARGDTVADTVAKLRLPPWGMGQFGEQKKMVSTVFGPRDLFGVLPDGSIWIARASTNSVDWRSPDGAWLRGERLPYAPIPVLQKEKDLFLERLRRQMATAGAPAGIELSYPFAEEKPPFIAGATNPAGEAWLQRPRPIEDSIPVWDAIGRNGKLLRSVRLPRSATLAGFGRDGRVYLVLREDDGTQRIARFTVPRSPL